MAEAQVISMDAEQARKARRARRERERYAANREKERERCRAGKQRQRGDDKTQKVSYDPDDYTEEWEFLTGMGVRSDIIIERSAPSRGWFSKWVRPRVHAALCASCGSLFSPQKSGMLTRCSATCGMADERNSG